MIFIRPQNDPKKARKKSRQNQPTLKQIRQELHESMISFIAVTLDRLEREGLPELPEKIEEKIGECCDFLAWIRHPLHHNLEGEIDEIPDPEFPTRLFNTVTKLTQLHAFIHERGEAADDDEAFALRIIADNIPSTRSTVLRHLTPEWTSTSILSAQSKIPVYTLRRVLDELVVLNICEKLSRESESDEYEIKDRRSNNYKLCDTWTTVIDQLKHVIRIGGRIEEKNKGNCEKESQEEEILVYPQKDMFHFSDNNGDSGGDNDTEPHKTREEVHYTTVKALADISTFVGLDGTEYTLHNGEVTAIPDDSAQVLIGRGLIEVTRNEHFNTAKELGFDQQRIYHLLVGNLGSLNVTKFAGDLITIKKRVIKELSLEHGWDPADISEWYHKFVDVTQDEMLCGYIAGICSRATVRKGKAL